MVFTDDGELSQMILCAEDQEICEVPGETLVKGLLNGLGLSPKSLQNTPILFQGILMERPDTYGPAKNRSTCHVTSLLLVGFSVNFY